jgi:hypothetical protein
MPHPRSVTQYRKRVHTAPPYTRSNNYRRNSYTKLQSFHFSSHWYAHSSFELRNVHVVCWHHSMQLISPSAHNTVTVMPNSSFLTAINIHRVKTATNVSTNYCTYAPRNLCWTSSSVHMSTGVPPYPLIQYPRFTAPPKNNENWRNKRFISFKPCAKLEWAVTWWNPAAQTRSVLDSSSIVPVLTLPRRICLHSASSVLAVRISCRVPAVFVFRTPFFIN